MGISELEAKALAESIRQMEALGSSGKASQNKLAEAKLKLACYVLKTQGMKPTLDNLASILGPDFKDALPLMADVKKELGADGPVLK